MPNGIKNWKFEDAVGFLTQHFFVCTHTKGSHHYFTGLVDGKEKLVDVWFHAGKALSPKGVKMIIHKSGIPQSVWVSWGESGNKARRTKVQYGGAKKIE